PFGDPPLKFILTRGGQHTVAVSVLAGVSRHIPAAPRPAGQIAVVVVAVVAVEQRLGGFGVFESRCLHFVVERLCFAVGIPVVWVFCFSELYFFVVCLTYGCRRVWKCTPVMPSRFTTSVKW